MSQAGSEAAQSAKISAKQSVQANAMPEAEGEFQLVSRYQPAGDQPTAIAGLVEGLRDGLSHLTLLGVTGSGKTFTMANVIAQMQRPAIIMAPNKTLAAQLSGEFK